MDEPQQKYPRIHRAITWVVDECPNCKVLKQRIAELEMATWGVYFQ